MTRQATAQLVRGGQALPGNQPIPVGVDGTTVALTVPPGLEIVDAALTIRLPDDSAPLELTTGALVASDLGAGAPTSAQAVQWVSYEWGVRRGLVRIKLTFADAGAATHVRLRLSDGGPWLLASPGPLLPITNKIAEAQVPGLSASRVMFEPVTFRPTALTPEDHPLAQNARLQAVSVAGARRPPALTVAVGDAIVHHEAALLPPGARVVVREALLAALRERVPGHAGGAAAIRLTAPADSAVQRIDLALRTREVETGFRGGGPRVAADVAPGGELVGQVDVALAPTRVRARVRAELRGEYRIPAAATTGHAHRCTPDSALAQAFVRRSDDALIGVDLLLGPRTAALAGRVSFHADDRGTPAAAPFAAVDVDLADLPGAGVAPQPRLVPLDLPEPALPPTPIFWVALALTAGEALWFLADASTDLGAPPLARRERGEPWVLRDMPFGTGPKRLVALAELRLRRAAPPDPPTLRLRWLAAGPPVASPGGRLDASGPDLPPAPDSPTEAPLELVATCPFAGRVELDELAVFLPEQAATLTFGS
jgi:hypothetical protein